MLHCTNSPGDLAAAAAADMTVLERQRARLRWQVQKDHFHGNDVAAGVVGGFQGLLMMGGVTGVADVFNQPVKPDPGWSELAGLELPGSCFEPCTFPDRQGKESPRKRKFDKVQNTKADDGTRDKKTRGVIADDEESKITEQSSNSNGNHKSKCKNSNSNKETSPSTSKETSKVSEVQKPDYIHVRARRGQATDSHSLAERARREKISERMKYLQDLVPGCNKITGKAGMLDEIINYVQSLQRQVEFLSMKLAAVNPVLDFNIDNLFDKEIFPTLTTSFPTMGISPEISHPAYLQLNQMQQAISCLGHEIGVTPISIPDTFSDTSWLNQIVPSTAWDSELQNFCSIEFHQGRATTFPSQQHLGSVEAGNLKVEM